MASAVGENVQIAKQSKVARRVTMCFEMKYNADKFENRTVAIFNDKIREQMAFVTAHYNETDKSIVVFVQMKQDSKVKHTDILKGLCVTQGCKWINLSRFASVQNAVHYHGRPYSYSAGQLSGRSKKSFKVTTDNPIPRRLQAVNIPASNQEPDSRTRVLLTS